MLLGDTAQRLAELVAAATPVETAIIHVGSASTSVNAPAITGINPSPVPGLDGNQLVTISGTGFIVNATVNWEHVTGEDGMTTLSSSGNSNTITASTNFGNQTASWQVQVVNPDGKQSNWWPFQVNASSTPKPDLVPENVSLSTTAVTAGGTMTVSLTMANQGQAAAGASTTRLRLNTSSSGTTKYDTSLGDLPTPSIPAGSSVQLSLSVTIPSGTSSGTYYVWAVADILSQVSQSNINNDYAVSLALTVSAGQTPVPTPISPGTNTDTGYQLNTTTPTMQWSGSGATTYELAISHYPYGTGNVVYDNASISGSATSLVIPGGTLQNGVKYRWDMQAPATARGGADGAVTCTSRYRHRRQ